VHISARLKSLLMFTEAQSTRADISKIERVTRVRSLLICFCRRCIVSESTSGLMCHLTRFCTSLMASNSCRLRLVCDSDFTFKYTKKTYTDDVFKVLMLQRYAIRMFRGTNLQYSALELNLDRINHQ
jgi:hypothetical protein